MLGRPTLAAVLLVLGLPASADAATCVSVGGNWHDTGSWTGCGLAIPNSDDDVVIPSTRTVTVSSANANANTIHLNAGGTLSVTGARTVAISGDSGVSEFEGSVEVLDLDSRLQLRGTVEWTAGDWSLGGERDGTVTNDPGGTVENSGTLVLNGTPTATNQGNGRMLNLLTGRVESNGMPIWGSRSTTTGR